MKLDKIIIFTRGKNKDEFGNPYNAYKIILQYSYMSYFRKVIIEKSMSYGNASAHDCLRDAVMGLNEFLFGIKHPRTNRKHGIIPTIIKMNDKRIEHYHKKVSTDAELEHPENWKVEY